MLLRNSCSVSPSHSPSLPSIEGPKTSGGAPQPSQRVTIRFIQDRNQPFRVTRDNPLSENNCIVCSFKNMLDYFDYSETKIQKTLEDVRLKIPQDPNNLYETSNGVELNYQFLLSQLKEQLGRQEDFEAYTKKGQADKIKQAIDARKPIWIVSSEKTTHTLAVESAKLDNGKHVLTDGHSYIIVPFKGTQDEYLVLDSLAGVTKLTTKELKKNLDAIPDDNLDYYHIIDRN
jgi:hypothetical protein